jgi:uncharacterized protein YdaU (DUF1376 family)
MKPTGLFWWIDRWRKSSAYMDMTVEQQGAYRNLLDEAHLRGGPLPNDERILAKACGDALIWDRVRVAVMARFDLRDDGWHNDTLDEVYRRTMQLSAARSKAGISGNRKRWPKTLAVPSQVLSQTHRLRLRLRLRLRISLRLRIRSLFRYNKLNERLEQRRWRPFL